MKFFLITLCFVFLSIFGAETMIMRSRPQSYYRGGTANMSTNAIHGDKMVNKIVQNSINNLALNLDRLLSKCSTTEGNIVFAPLNLLKTLSTVMLGTAGRTETELANALGPKLLGRPLNKITDAMFNRESENEKNETSLPEFHSGMGRLMRNIASQPGVQVGSNLNVASGLFIENGYPVKQTYKNQAMRIYNTEVFNMNFSTDGYNSANFINQWIDEKTHGRIKDVLTPPVNPLTQVIFASAMYFNGDWEYPFSEKITKWQAFYLGAEGKYGKEGRVLVEMMVNSAKIPTYENKQLGFTAIGMPYKGGDVIMYVILPKLKTSLKELMCRLKPEDIDTVISKSQPTDVLYVIPKMRLEHESNLRDTLQQLNADSIFDPQTANFSNLAEVDGVYVSDILHKVDVELNEKGTVAAAATVVTMNRGGFFNFRADRPFLFFIYNVKVGIITFWGSVKKPTPFRTS